MAHTSTADINTAISKFVKVTRTSPIRPPVEDVKAVSKKVTQRWGKGDLKKMIKGTPATGTRNEFAMALIREALSRGMTLTPDHLDGMIRLLIRNYNPERADQLGEISQDVTETAMSLMTGDLRSALNVVGAHATREELLAVMQEETETETETEAEEEEEEEEKEEKEDPKTLGRLQTTPEQRAALRERKTMTPQQRAALRKKTAAMTPEQRMVLRKKTADRIKLQAQIKRALPSRLHAAAATAVSAATRGSLPLPGPGQPSGAGRETPGGGRMPDSMRRQIPKQDRPAADSVWSTLRKFGLSAAAGGSIIGGIYQLGSSGSSPQDPEDPRDPPDLEDPERASRPLSKKSTIEDIMLRLRFAAGASSVLGKLAHGILRTRKAGDSATVAKIDELMRSLAASDPEKMKGTLGQIKDLLINGELLETHLSGYRYLGPGTRLFERLTSEPTIKSVPINSLDALALQHDLAYSTGDRGHMRRADDLMIEKMKPLYSASSDVRAAYWVMSLKRFMDQSLNMDMGPLTGSGKTASADELELTSRVYDDYLLFLERSGITFLPDNAGLSAEHVDFDAGREIYNDMKESAMRLAGVEDLPEGEVRRFAGPRGDNLKDPIEKKEKEFVSPHIPEMSSFSTLVQNLNSNQSKENSDALLAALTSTINVSTPELDAAVKLYHDSPDQMVRLGALLNRVIPAFKNTVEGQAFHRGQAGDFANLKALRDSIKEQFTSAPTAAPPTMPPPTEEELQHALTMGRDQTAGPTAAESARAPPTEEELQHALTMGRAPPTAAPTSTTAPTSKALDTVAPTAAPTSTTAPTSKAPLFVERPVPANQIKNQVEDRIDSADFQKLRPDFKVLDERELEQEVEQINDKDIREETIDFSYVPVTQNRSPGNTVLQDAATTENIQYSGPFLNHTKIGFASAVGAKPTREKALDGTPLSNGTQVEIKSLTKPMFEATSLGWDIPFRSATQPLNIDLAPIQNDNSNLYARDWMGNILLNPQPDQEPFIDPHPKGRQEKPTTIQADEAIQTGLGLGTDYDGTSF
jgi:hypothetical protein